MVCVYKEYEVKMKMVQEQWLQLKMTFFLGCNIKVLFSGEREINLLGAGGRKASTEGIAPVGWNNQILS